MTPLPLLPCHVAEVQTNRANHRFFSTARAIAITKKTIPKRNPAPIKNPVSSVVMTEGVGITLGVKVNQWNFRYSPPVPLMYACPRIKYVPFDPVVGKRA